MGTLRSNKTQSKWYTKRAMLYIVARNEPAALENIETALEKNPLNAEALTYLGALYEQHLNSAKALEFYEKALQAFEQDPAQDDDSVIKKSLHKIESTAWDVKYSLLSARDTANKFVSMILPFNNLNSHIQSAVNMDQMMYDAICKAEESRVHIEEVKLLRAKALYNCGKIAESMQQFQLLLQDTNVTDKNRYIFQYAQCLFYLRDWQLARATFTDLIEQKEERYMRICLAYRAFCLKQMDQVQEAEQDHKAAVLLGAPEHFFPLRLLSGDVWQGIYGFLHARDLCHVTLVCRFMKKQASGILNSLREQHQQATSKQQ